MNNLLIQDVGAEKDTITNLRAPTHFGRPNVSCYRFDCRELTFQWDRVFESIASKHPDTDCGVFFCGPPALSRTLHQMSNKYTSPMGCRFFFGKEVRCAMSAFAPSLTSELLIAGRWEIPPRKSSIDARNVGRSSRCMFADRHEKSVRAVRSLSSIRQQRRSSASRSPPRSSRSRR